MRYNSEYARSLGLRLRATRKARGLSQSALAASSGAGRVTIARLEAGAAQDFRLGTLARVCSALGMELAAVPQGGQDMQERVLARERDRARHLEARRRHAVLAARLLAMSSRQAAVAIGRARSMVVRWERERLCSMHYISRWRSMLAGGPRRVAATLLGRDEWTDALFQNSPWSFALEPAEG